MKLSQTFSCPLPALSIFNLVVGNLLPVKLKQLVLLIDKQFFLTQITDQDVFLSYLIGVSKLLKPVELLLTECLTPLIEECCTQVS